MKQNIIREIAKITNNDMKDTTHLQDFKPNRMFLNEIIYMTATETSPKNHIT